MEKIKIAAIVGSLRKDSFNRQLALAAQKALGDRAEFTLVEYEDVPMMNQDIEFPAPAAVTRVREQVKAADALWIFTPEYNHFFPGVLKNLLDWLSRPVSEQEGQVLAGKPAAISGATPSMSGTAIAQDHLVTLLSFLNMDIMNAPRLTVPAVLNQLDEQGRLKLDSSAPFLQKQADAFLEFVKARTALKQ
jgi:chromate reductase